MIAAFHGGPLNASRVEVDELAETRAHEGGRYVLDGGAYYWHVGGAARSASGPQQSEPKQPARREPAPSAAPRPRTRARKRSTS